MLTYILVKSRATALSAGRWYPFHPAGLPTELRIGDLSEPGTPR